MAHQIRAFVCPKRKKKRTTTANALLHVFVHVLNKEKLILVEFNLSLLDLDESRPYSDGGIKIGEAIHLEAS